MNEMSNHVASFSSPELPWFLLQGLRLLWYVLQISAQLLANWKPKFANMIYLRLVPKCARNRTTVETGQ